MAESIQSTSQSSLAPSTPSTSLQDIDHVVASASQSQHRRASLGLLDSARIRLSKDFYSLVHSNTKPRQQATTLSTQIESVDDCEDLLLTGYAAPMGQSEFDIPHLQMYSDLREQGRSSQRVKESKFYTFIHRPRSASRPVLDAARRSRSAEPVPVLPPTTAHDRSSHTRHVSLDDHNNYATQDAHHDDNVRSKLSASPSKPSQRSPSRPLSASTSATNGTANNQARKLRRPNRPEGITIPPSSRMLDVHDLTSRVVSPERHPTQSRTAPHSRDTRNQSPTKSPNPLAKLFRGLSSPRKSSAPLPRLRSRSPDPVSNPSSPSQSPIVGIYPVPGSPRKERGRSQTCWRFFSASNSGSASGSALHASASTENRDRGHASNGAGNPGKIPATSGDLSAEKSDARYARDTFHAHGQNKGSGDSRREEKNAGVTVVPPHSIPTRAISSHMHGRVHPRRVYTSPNLGSVNEAERESIGTEKLGRCSPLLLGFGVKGRSKERKEKAKVEVKAVSEPIIRDLGADKNASRATVGIGRPYAPGTSVAGSNVKVKRSSAGSGSKSGPMDLKIARRLKHGSFDFERPASGSSAGGRSVKGGKDKERMLDGHRNARVVDSTLTASASNARRHPQKIQFKSPSESEDNGATGLKRRGTGTSATSHTKSRGHGYSQSQTSISNSAGSNEGREAGGSWGRSHHPPSRSALHQRNRHLGTFQFEPAVPFVPSVSPKDETFPSKGPGAPLYNKTPKANLMPSSPLVDDSSSHSAPSTKAKSLDLGLGLAWAPSKIKEGAIFPHSHGLGIIRSKEREQVFKEVRAVVGELGLQRVEKYVRRYEAGQIPLDGPAGFDARVRKILQLDSSPSPLSGLKTERRMTAGERNRHVLMDRLVRVAQAAPAPAA